MKSPTGFNTGVKIEKRYFIYFLKSIFCKDFFLHLIQIVNWKSLSTYHHACSAQFFAQWHVKCWFSNLRRFYPWWRISRFFKHYTVKKKKKSQGYTRRLPLCRIKSQFSGLFVVSINKEHLFVRDTNGTNNGTYGIIMQTNTISMLKLKAIYTIIELVWKISCGECWK